MKDIVSKINESGSSFSEQVKYSKSDWENGKKKLKKMYSLVIMKMNLI